MKTITQTITKGCKEKSTMIVCDNCNKNGTQTEINETGFPNVGLASREKSALEVTFLVDEGDIFDVLESKVFAKELEGDWCQSCAREKLKSYLE